MARHDETKIITGLACMTSRTMATGTKINSRLRMFSGAKSFFIGSTLLGRSFCAAR
jgi:hypothetical protein